MSTLDLRVHHYKRINDGSQAVLTQLKPYIALCKANDEEGGSTRVFVQNGQFFHEGGAEYKKTELPSWLSTELAKLSPDARKEVGLTPPAKED